MVERVRLALLLTRDLTAAERHVALLMLEGVNQERFNETGLLFTWRGEAAYLCGLTDKGVQKIRRRLRDLGIVDVWDGRKGGKGKTATYFVCFPWVEKTERQLANTAIKLMKGETTVTRLREERSNPGHPFPSSKEVTAGSKGETAGTANPLPRAPQRGNTGHPDSLDKHSRESHSRDSTSARVRSARRREEDLGFDDDTLETMKPWGRA
jgi:hypothetical protein